MPWPPAARGHRAGRCPGAHRRVIDLGCGQSRRQLGEDTPAAGDDDLAVGQERGDVEVAERQVTEDGCLLSHRDGQGQNAAVLAAERSVSSTVVWGPDFRCYKNGRSVV